MKIMFVCHGNICRSLADPGYSDDFETTYADILEGCKGLLKYCLKEDR